MTRRTVIAAFAVWLIVTIAGVGVAFVLTRDNDSDAESGANGGDRPSPSSTLGGDPADVQRFYDQQLDWKRCGRLQCAFLEVPIDYQAPAEGTIFLNVERTRATGDRVGSLVVNPGGPGAPASDMVRNASAYFGDPLLEAYDVVAVDPRGTGKSSPIDCIGDRALDKQLASDPDPDTPAEVDEAASLLKDFWAGCEKRSAKLAAHVSTVEAARDMDVLRAALGQDKLDYMGFSYGTKLGATYAELYPENVGRLVLDGAVDPALSSRQSSLSQAAGFELALRSYVAACVKQPDCAIGRSVDAGLATIKGLLDDIDAKPLRTSDPDRPLTVGLAFYGLITPLYSEDNWTYLDLALQQALDGDGSVLLELADIYGSREKDGSFSDNSLEAISVINCLDDPTSIPVADVPAQFPDFEKASPTFGDVFAWGLSGCQGIPFKATDSPDLVIDGDGAAPIMVIGTTRDPATPYEEAVALSKELTSGFLVTRDGDGHTGYNKGNACVDDAVHAYLIDGTVPEGDPTC